MCPEAQKTLFPIDLPILENNLMTLSEEFKSEILCNIRNDEIGMLIKKDSPIFLIGCRLFDKVKKRTDNAVGCKKDVRTKMRILAHLYSKFLDLKPKVDFKNSQDMYAMRNFELIKEAVSIYTCTENDIKAGLKVNVQYIIIKAVKILKATSITESREQETEMFEKFLSVFQVWQVCFL